MITRLTKDNLADLHKANQPFDVIGKMDMTFQDGIWQRREVLFDTPYAKQYPNYDGAEPSDYVDAADRAAFLAYKNGECVGQILLCRTWNAYAHIEDISVARAWRGKGVGTALLASAVTWAKENRICGLSLESQDNNLLASRFFVKHGFFVGGVNTELYRHMGAPYNTETAVFWYLNL